MAQVGDLTQGNPSITRRARDGVWTFVMEARPWYFFWLGLRGAVGALAWLAFPIALLAVGWKFPLLGFLGFVLLLPVLVILPFLQMQFAARNRFATMFDVVGVVRLYLRAPWACSFALFITLLFALPLYLLKIELIPQDAVKFEALVFIAFIWPARLLTGWVCGLAEHRPCRRHWFFWTTGALPVPFFVVVYGFFVWLSQYLAWYGVASLYEQHAFRRIDAIPPFRHDSGGSLGAVDAMERAAMLHAMIMAGGGGTRFWPRSRQQRPKPFLTLSGDRSLLQQAMDRIEVLAPPERCWVITSEEYRDETSKQLPTLPPDHVVGEPCRRDTAPCIGLGAALIALQDPTAIMLVTPADHVIEPVQEFRRGVQVAALMAEEHPSALVTFGIPPTYPSTGYGYIQRGPLVANRQGVNVYRVERFKEKPDAETAERYIVSGDYFWNSGIFVWKAATVLPEAACARASAEDVQRAVQAVIAEAWNSPHRDAVLRQEYEGIERDSIDYAVMEGAKDVLVVFEQAPYKWDDVGSWLALERMNPQDAHGNTVLGTHCGLHTNNCVIVAEAGRLEATIGVDNLLIVQDGDATLVADRIEDGTVKQLVDYLKKKGLEKHL